MCQANKRGENWEGYPQQAKAWKEKLEKENKELRLINMCTWPKACQSVTPGRAVVSSKTETVRRDPRSACICHGLNVSFDLCIFQSTLSWSESQLLKGMFVQIFTAFLEVSFWCQYRKWIWILHKWNQRQEPLPEYASLDKAGNDSYKSIVYKF